MFLKYSYHGACDSEIRCIVMSVTSHEIAQVIRCHALCQVISKKHQVRILCPVRVAAGDRDFGNGYTLIIDFSLASRIQP